jgi:hypothetical protein
MDMKEILVYRFNYSNVKMVNNTFKMDVCKHTRNMFLEISKKMTMKSFHIKHKIALLSHLLSVAFYAESVLPTSYRLPYAFTSPLKALLLKFLFVTSL